MRTECKLQRRLATRRSGNWLAAGGEGGVFEGKKQFRQEGGVYSMLIK